MGSGRGQTKRTQARSTMASLGRAFDQQYHEAVEYLDENFTYFLTHVLNAGKPQASSMVPTACVALPTKSTRLQDFEFHFNPEFAAGLTAEEMGFVLAHETMHVLLNHLRLTKEFDNQQIANLAMDAVINDYLVDLGLEMVEGGVTGDALVGHNCANSTVAEVYAEVKRDVEQQQQQQSQDGGQGMPGGGGGKGDPSDDDADGSGDALSDLLGDFKQLDDHTWIWSPDDAQAQQDAADAAAQGLKDSGQMPQSIEDKKDAEEKGRAKGYSLFGGTSETQFVEDKGVKLKWLKLLQKIDPDIIKKKGLHNSEHETWSRPHRKTMRYYPSVLLPGIREDEPVRKRKESIVLALDTSGSIGAATANKFVNLARSIPQERVELHVCTFTTQYSKLDLDNPRFGSGGTNFSAIEQFIRKEVLPTSRNKYPSAVVVITDGQAEFSGPAPAKENEDAWTWLLTDDAYEGYCSPSWKMGEHHKLKDFT